MISQELHEFCERWLRKAERSRGQSLNNCFDRFFSLFVVYNRLYAELTLSWARVGRIVLPGSSIPDGIAAKRYVRTYLTGHHIWEAVNAEAECQQAVSRIRDLIETRTFSIKLDRLTGNPRPEADQKLLECLTSGSIEQRSGALLDIVYSLRCNMFHGHKGFDEVQVEILSPANTLLKKLTILLYEKLSQDHKLGMLPPPNLDAESPFRR